MPRIRSIKPEFWADDKIGKLTPYARLLFIALWNFADDHGVISASPRRILGECFENDPDVNEKQVAKLLAEIETQKFLVRFSAEGKDWLYVRNWRKHQRVEKISWRRNPKPPAHLLVGEGSPTDSPTPSPTDSGEAPDVDTGYRILDKDKDRDTDAPTPPESAAPAPLDSKNQDEDPIRIALREIFGWNPVTKSEKTHLAALARDFRLKGAAGVEMWERVRRYRRAWPKVECSPDALLKHWDRFAAPVKPVKTESAADRQERERREKEEAEWKALDPEERVRQMDAILAELQDAFPRCA